MNMQFELISVIIPVYNVELYLAKCVESVQSQTYKNLEIILVDDGSQDNCGQISDSLAQNDARIRVIHQENQGLSAARNVGIQMSKGDFIVFIDSDDWIEPNMCELLYMAITENNADMSICGIKYFQSDGSVIKTILPRGKGVCEPQEVLPFLFDEQRTPYITAWTKMYKRSLFQSICFPTRKINEDEFIALNIIFACNKIAIIQTALYNYVIRNTSIMGQTYSVKRMDGIEANYEQYCFLRDHGFIEYLHCARKTFLGAYAYGKAHFKPKNEQEKKRCAEIDKLMQTVIQDFSIGALTWKEKLARYCPRLFLCLAKCKQKIKT